MIRSAGRDSFRSAWCAFSDEGSDGFEEAAFLQDLCNLPFVSNIAIVLPPSKCWTCCHPMERITFSPRSRPMHGKHHVGRRIPTAGLPHHAAVCQQGSGCGTYFGCSVKLNCQRLTGRCPVTSTIGWP